MSSLNGYFLKSHILDGIYTVGLMGFILGILFLEYEHFNPYFIVVGVGVLILLRVILVWGRNVPTWDDRRLDQELQKDLINHRISVPPTRPLK